MLDDFPSKRPIPFYGSYASFLRGMRALKKHGMPSRLNTKSLTPLLRRDEPARILAGLVSLGWVDDYGHPSKDFEKLAHAYGNDSEWKSALFDIVPKAYAFLPGDWVEMTPNDLREAFKAYTGRDAEAIRSAETFFICLAIEANLPIGEIFYRRAGRQITEAKRSVIIEELEDNHSDAPLISTQIISEPAETIKIIDDTNDDRSNTNSAYLKTTSVWSVWIEQVLNLIDVLDDHEMTDKERAALFTLLATLRRRKQKNTKAISP